MSVFKTIQLDTEFHSSQELDVTPVCAVIRKEGVARRYWAETDTDKFLTDLRELVQDHHVIGFYCSAEARYLFACGMSFEEVLAIKWLDPWIWWRMLTHSHPDYRYGRQVVADRKTGTRSWVTSKAPPNRKDSMDTWSEDEDGNTTFKEVTPTYRPVPVSLAGAVAHAFGVDMDSSHKTKMRDLILTGGPYSFGDQLAIMDYCEEDTTHLLPLLQHLATAISRLTFKEVGLADLIRLSRYMICCAKMESNGIPFALDKAQNLGKNYLQLDEEIIDQANSHYPFFRVSKSTKKDREQGKKEYKWVADSASFERYVDEAGLAETWPRSEKTQKCKQDKETLKEYKADATVEALRVCKESRNQIKYFRPQGFRNLAQNIGSDNRIRVLLSPYGSKTGRNQPSVAKGYIYGMCTWLRPLIEHESLIVQGADFSAQEIALQGWVSGDGSFLEAYKSGDPYVWFALMTGLLPQGVQKTKKGYTKNGELMEDAGQAYCKGVRNVCKALTLGVGFGMGLDKLGASLTKARLSSLPMEQQQTINASRLSTATAEMKALAKEIIDSVRVYSGVGPGSAQIPHDQSAAKYKGSHQRVFRTYWAWRDKIIQQYHRDGFLKLVDKWCLFLGEDRPNTIANFPVQGVATAILRVAVELCLLAGLEVIAPLHDCIYIVSKPEKAKEEMELLKSLMTKAVIQVCGYDLIRIDGDAYHTDWTTGVSTWTKDKQGKEFERFSKYMLSDLTPPPVIDDSGFEEVFACACSEEYALSINTENLDEMPF